MPDSSEQGRRWTLWVCPVGHVYAQKDAEDIPGTCQAPGMLAGWCQCRMERVEVLPVSEHVLVVQERDRLRAECRRLEFDYEVALAERFELTEAARAVVTETCREWPKGEDRCNAPAEFVLWGKLIDPEGLGPRCYDHAAKHVGHLMLTRRLAGDPLKLEAAVMDLRPLRAALAQNDEGPPPA